MKTKKNFAALIELIGRFHSRAANGEEKLWKVWWIVGIPLGWASSTLVVIAEDMRYADHPGWSDFLDVVRFLVFFAWLRFSWRCSHNVERPIWTPVAQATLSAGLLCMAMF
jgi:hypothetical protein